MIHAACNELVNLHSVVMHSFFSGGLGKKNLISSLQHFLIFFENEDLLTPPHTHIKKNEKKKYLYNLNVQ